MRPWAKITFAFASFAYKTDVLSPMISVYVCRAANLAAGLSPNGITCYSYKELN